VSENEVIIKGRKKRYPPSGWIGLERWAKRGHWRWRRKV